MNNKTYSQSSLRGQIHCPAAVTPFGPDGELLLDDFAMVLRYHLEVVNAGSLLIAGCNGEGYAISDSELGQITEVANATLGVRMPYYVSVTRTPLAECLARAEIVAENGGYGIALGQAQIYDMTESEVVRRFETVGKAVPLPMMIYNMSHLSHFSIGPETMRRICDVVPAEIIKDVPTDFDHIKRMIVEVGNRVPVLYGHKDTLIPALLLGSGGFVGTGPELFGKHARDMFFGVHHMTPEERLEVHCRYSAVSDALMWSVGKPPAAIKTAMKMIGVPGGQPREHVLPLTRAEENYLRNILTEAGILEGEIAKRA